MKARLRVARLPAARVPDDWENFYQRYQQVQGLIRRYLPAACASLFAEPRATKDPGLVDWYSDLEGQPRSVESLSPEQQAAARKLLADRMQSIRELAERLHQVEPESATLSDTLLKRLQFPGSHCLYVVEGQPVIAFWGDPGKNGEQLAPASELEPVTPNIEVEPTPPAKKKQPIRWLRWFYPIFGLGVLAVAWFFFQPHLKQWLQPNYWEMYQSATGNCGKLEELEVLLHAPQVVETPELESVREAVAKERSVCLTPDYWKMFEDAQDDCARLSSLSDTLMAEDVVVTDALPKVRLAITQALEACALSHYQDLLDSAGDDCNKLSSIHSDMQRLANTTSTALLALYQRYHTKLGQCRLAELEQQLRATQGNCSMIKQISEKLQKADYTIPGFDDFYQKLNKALADCQTSQAKAAPETKKRLCPGERPKALAPDLVLVVDASNSMNAPINVSDKELSRLEVLASKGDYQAMTQFIKLMDSGEKRISVAKRTAQTVVSSLPEDVDTGLVLVSECPEASSKGFFSGAQRSQILSQIKEIRTSGGTPLASGMKQASQMVDGVNAAALLVLISDGAESCQGDPCAVAREIAANKPKLKINVVDIMGTGAASCAAQLTGGKVLTARNATQFETMLDTAVAEVKGPKECYQ